MALLRCHSNTLMCTPESFALGPLDVQPEALPVQITHWVRRAQGRAVVPGEDSLACPSCPGKLWRTSCPTELSHFETRGLFVPGSQVWGEVHGWFLGLGRGSCLGEGSSLWRRVTRHLSQQHLRSVVRQGASNTHRHHLTLLLVHCPEARDPPPSYNSLLR